jgi:hypothetical protein
MSEPPRRRELVPHVEQVIDSLDPRDGLAEGVAAAEVCRGAGAGVLPLPIEAMLMSRSQELPLVLLSAGGRFEHADLFDSWEVCDPSGRVTIAQPNPDLIGSKVGPFVNRTGPESGEERPPLTGFERAMLLNLCSWYVFGALEKALDLATVYATERVTFGSPISSNQGVAFPLADACSEMQALYELAVYTLQRAYDSPESAGVDGLALRWATLDIGQRVLRTAHQVLGAVGQCDEHDLSIITLALQARLRMPFGAEACLTRLAGEVARSGFDSLF